MGRVRILRGDDGDGDGDVRARDHDGDGDHDGRGAPVASLASIHVHHKKHSATVRSMQRRKQKCIFKYTQSITKISICIPEFSNSEIYTTQWHNDNTKDKWFSSTRPITRNHTVIT